VRQVREFAGFPGEPLCQQCVSVLKQGNDDKGAGSLQVIDTLSEQAGQAVARVD